MPLIYEFPGPLSHSASPFAKLRPRHSTSLQDHSSPRHRGGEFRLSQLTIALHWD